MDRPKALPANVTADDVAAAAGVSRWTVTRAFKKGASISPATRDKVMRAAQELGYVPDLQAAGLASARSNLVALVIDDFGRQRISTAELLNRWIIPLEKGHDYLSLPSGRQIQIPFDPLVVFATNLLPENVVDEAFLRRIPFKIEMIDPTETEFRALFDKTAQSMGVACPVEAFQHLIARYYRETGRPYRYCHVRDLLFQLKTIANSTIGRSR